MPPLYRIVEMCVYSLLNFLPFMALVLYPFRSRLRFSAKITVCIIVVISFIQMGLGLWAAFFSGGKAALASAVSTAVYVVFYFIAVKVNFGKALFTLLMISNMANFVVAVAKCIEGKIFPELAVQLYRWSFSLIMFFVLAVVWTPLFIYTKKVYTPAVEKEPTGIEWRYLWLIPATFYLIWYYMLYNNSGKSSLETALDIGNAIFLFVINVGACLVYYVIVKLINEQEKNIRLSENNHRLAMQNLQYENLQEKIADARRAKHDVRHHISLMQEYVRNKEYDKLEKYLNSYQQSLPDDTLISFCENKAVNAVMLYFAQAAKNADIDYDVKAVIPEKIAIDETDLSVLFGNLIENAIDACKAESSDNKKIVIRAMTDEYTLCLGIDNTFTGTIKKDLSGVLFSSKHIGYGIGVESVKSIAEKYGGAYRSEVKDGMFMSSVLLNLKT
ncbi:MAG: sensor histidine kinase [Ruminiclostridium sp.]|nr:sensor histidine kinase [Ruminiclostridium sp.]